MTERTFLSKDEKTTIHYYVWEPAGQPKAILQIVHGMAEHILRYSAFAEYLNSQGILVCGNDHIGHGSSSAPEDWGYMGEEDGWKIMVQDVEQLHGIMKVQYMDVPYFMLGHSMGSFIARAWLSMIGRGIDGVIIMGTAGGNSALVIAKPLVATLKKTQGSKHVSKTINAMAFGSYNKHFKPIRTEFDWLTRDEAVVDKYLEDPSCGFVFTLAGFADLFNLISYVNSDNWYKLVPKDMPILIVSGTEDPVGAYGKGPAEVADGLEEEGCGDVSLILYEDMRHEILNEFGKEVVYEDLKRFILDEAPIEAEETHEQPQVAVAPEQPKPAASYEQPKSSVDTAAIFAPVADAAEAFAEQNGHQYTLGSMIEKTPVAEPEPVAQAVSVEEPAPVAQAIPVAPAAPVEEPTRVFTPISDSAALAAFAAETAAAQQPAFEPQPVEFTPEPVAPQPVEFVAEPEPATEAEPEATVAKTELEKVLDSFRAMGATIEYMEPSNPEPGISEEYDDVDARSESFETPSIEAVSADLSRAIARISDQAEELANKYDRVPGNVRRLADKAEELANKYNG